MPTTFLLKLKDTNNLLERCLANLIIFPILIGFYFFIKLNELPGHFVTVGMKRDPLRVSGCPWQPWSHRHGYCGSFLRRKEASPKSNPLSLPLHHPGWDMESAPHQGDPEDLGTGFLSLMLFSLQANLQVASTCIFENTNVNL